jgi:hypothetical protein
MPPVAQMRPIFIRRSCGGQSGCLGVLSIAAIMYRFILEAPKTIIRYSSMKPLSKPAHCREKNMKALLFPCVLQIDSYV